MLYCFSKTTRHIIFWAISAFYFFGLPFVFSNLSTWQTNQALAANFEIAHQNNNTFQGLRTNIDIRLNPVQMYPNATVLAFPFWIRGSVVILYCFSKTTGHIIFWAISAFYFFGLPFVFSNRSIWQTNQVLAANFEIAHQNNNTFQGLRTNIDIRLIPVQMYPNYANLDPEKKTF